MYLDAAKHELTGLAADANSWAGALWNNPPSEAAFSNPIEVWATLARVGRGDALLYADVGGGASGLIHASSGYFAEFGNLNSTASTGHVSIWEITGPTTVSKLTEVNLPSRRLAVGDRIGLSINRGVITAWYRPAAGVWRAMVSSVDTTYTSGDIALEDIPGPAFGFAAFGGGTPLSPVTSRQTVSTITTSATTVGIGQRVTYTATLTPAPREGTVAFVDDDVIVPQCEAQAVNRYGQATCTVSYKGLGAHMAGAIYSGSPDGAFAGSTNGPDAQVLVAPFSVGRPLLRIGKERFDVVVGCPPRSGSCAITSSLTIPLSAARGQISLRAVSGHLKAGRSRHFVFVISRGARAALRRYLIRHRNALLGVAVNLAVQSTSGGSDQVTFTYSVAGARALAAL